jgi:RNA polymerase sigma-70 factor (ECF subfamily)
MRGEEADKIQEFRLFRDRLQNGESAAERMLFDDYSQRLFQLASRNIHPALLKRFDGEDVVQSVFRTFFRQHGEGKFHIEHSEQLWQLLVALTLRKTRSHARKHTAEKRDATADQAITHDHQLLDLQPSPEDAIALWEEIDVALDGLPARTVEIVSMRLEGKNYSEISRELNLSRQTIHRLLNLIQERLEQRLGSI